MAKPRTEQSYLIEANGIVHDLHHRVFYKKESFQVGAGSSEYQFHYVIYRAGMGLIGKYRTPQALVAFLRRQLPTAQTQQRDLNLKEEQ